MRTRSVIERANYTVRVLARELGRIPSVDEALIRYEQLGLNTKEDQKGRRRRRMADAIRYTERTFDPARTVAGGFQSHQDERLSLVRAKVGPEHLDRTALCYKKGVTAEDLAIALYCVERSTFHTSNDFRRHTCAVAAIKRMLHVLKAAGDTKRGCNKNKAVALKAILQRAGLIEVTDYTKVVGGPLRGRAYRIVVGPEHSRRQEYEGNRRFARDGVDPDLGCVRRPSLPMSVDHPRRAGR